MKKLLIHLGLPKTATTTLQHNIFQPLHDTGKINYLGKVIDFDKRTGHPTYRNNVGGIIRKASEGGVNSDMQKELDSLLQENKLNVYSEEGIMVCYPGHNNMPLESKIENLKKLLENYDVEVLISLRNPADYFYSLYVELYPDYFSKECDINTFNKCVIDLLNNQNKNLYEAFFLEYVLTILAANFRITVLLYENLKDCAEEYIETLGEILNVEETIISSYFGLEYKNSKKAVENGVYSEKIITAFPLVRYAKKVTARFRLMHDILAFLYKRNILFIYSISRVAIRKKLVLHEKPDNILREKLVNALGFSPDFDFDRYGLNRSNMHRYGYVKE